jgi:hypothetical protein
MTSSGGSNILPFELYVPEHLANKPVPLTIAERLLVDRLIETEQRASMAEVRAARLEEALRWVYLHVPGHEADVRAAINGLLG